MFISLTPRYLLTYAKEPNNFRIKVIQFEVVYPFSDDRGFIDFLVELNKDHR